MTLRNKRKPARIQKVVAYITLGDKLLVFNETGCPEAGTQVPAGTVEENEALRDAVLREAQEETGLEGLELVEYLGTNDIEGERVACKGELHERHFFHLKCANPTPENWRHYEMTPNRADKTPIAYDLFWVKKEEAKLYFDFGDFLGKLA